MSLYSFGKVIVIPIFKLFFGLKIVGADNFPLDRQVIVAANHTSNFDPILAGIACKKQLFFMAKAELFRFKPLGALLGALGAFPINRGHRDREAMHNAYEIIAQGKTLAIFPQGTRVRNEDPALAKSGVAIFAEKTNTPVLPVYIYNKSGKVHGFSRNVVVIGKPIETVRLVCESGTVLEYREKAELIMKEVFALKADTGKDKWRSR